MTEVQQFHGRTRSIRIPNPGRFAVGSSSAMPLGDVRRNCNLLTRRRRSVGVHCHLVAAAVTQLYCSLNVTSNAPFAKCRERNQCGKSANEPCGNCGRLNSAVSNNLSASGPCLKRCDFVQALRLDPLTLPC